MSRKAPAVPRLPSSDSLGAESESQNGNPVYSELDASLPQAAAKGCVFCVGAGPGTGLGRDLRKLAHAQTSIREKNSGTPRTPSLSRNRAPAAAPSVALRSPPAVVT